MSGKKGLNVENLTIKRSVSVSDRTHLSRPCLSRHPLMSIILAVIESLSYRHIVMTKRIH